MDRLHSPAVGVVVGGDVSSKKVNNQRPQYTPVRIANHQIVQVFEFTNKKMPQIAETGKNISALVTYGERKREANKQRGVSHSTSSHSTGIWERRKTDKEINLES